MPRRNAVVAFCLGVCVATGWSGVAAAFQVQPMIVDLNKAGGRGLSTSVQVTNIFETPLPVEVRVTEIEFGPTGPVDTKRESDDLLVFPIQAIVQPGKTQNLRVQYVGDPELARSKHYYITVAQLPVALEKGVSAIQVLYNFQVMVSVGARDVKPAIRVAEAGFGKNDHGKPVPLLTLKNDSTNYGYASEGRIRLVQTDASGNEVFSKTLRRADIQQSIGAGLVGPGASRQIKLTTELPSDQGALRAEYTYERAR